MMIIHPKRMTRRLNSNMNKRARLSLDTQKLHRDVILLDMTEGLNAFLVQLARFKVFVERVEKSSCWHRLARVC